MFRRARQADEGGSGPPARLRWLRDNLVSTFGVTRDDAMAFLEGPAQMAVADLFSRADTRRLIIFHQAKASEAVPHLFLTDGASERLQGTAAYVVKTKDSVDPDVATDGALLYGEVNADMLALLEASLSEVYTPMLRERDPAAWQNAEEKYVQDFLATLDRFTNDVGDTLRSIGGGVELEAPPESVNVGAALRDPVAWARRNTKDRKLLETVVESWCQDAEDYLSEDAQGEPTDKVGPRGVLEFWRVRLQRLTSLTELVQRPEYADCVSVLIGLASAGGDSAGVTSSSLFTLLRRWKALDVHMTEALNEAKDNTKYLSTLEPFLIPLYGKDPLEVVDALPALMNALKLLQQIARYMSPERMQDLFVRITRQMIEVCVKHILACGDDPKTKGSQLWSKDPTTLVAALEACLQLNEAYQDSFRFTRDALAAQDDAKNFDYDERAIFGEIDLFTRRCVKLIDLFSTIAQQNALAAQRLEGMESINTRFDKLVAEFKRHSHDLLAYRNQHFDRDFVAFLANYSDLVGDLQAYIRSSFDQITDIMAALKLLSKYQQVLVRDTLKTELESKVARIFSVFAGELEMVQALYEKHKHNPPVARNLPPVAGNITWSRHLLRRIEQPMRYFERNQSVLVSPQARRVVKLYNRVARTIIAYEYLWFQAWSDSIEAAKEGLSSTLIIRHVKDGKLYINLDAEILQLIREAKALDRMGISIPAEAKIILLQEDKFKSYHAALTSALNEYARICSRIIPVTAPLLRPAIHDLELRLRPGLQSITWTSLNVDAFLASVQAGLARLEELVNNANDIIEHRIENNMRKIAAVQLVALPAAGAVTLDEFVSNQRVHWTGVAKQLSGKNLELESATRDVLRLISSYPVDAHIEGVNPASVERLREHYNNFAYSAFLGATKASLNLLKHRVSSVASAGEGRGPGQLAAALGSQPLIQVELQLSPPHIILSPSLAAVQNGITTVASGLLRVTAELSDWGQDMLPEEAPRATFFDRVGSDIEVVRVALLLTGSIKNLAAAVERFKLEFNSFNWLWERDIDESYAAFSAQEPSLEDYENELARFSAVEAAIHALPEGRVIGALQLHVSALQRQMLSLVSAWRARYMENLHRSARVAMAQLAEYVKTSLSKLARPVDTLDSLRFIMEALREIRDRESYIDAELAPIYDTYAMLEAHGASIDKEELDLKSVLRSNWRRLVTRADEVTDDIAGLQGGFKTRLLRDVRMFVQDVAAFRDDYEQHGPMVVGISPEEAMDRLRRYEDELDIRLRKAELFASGEDLFALPRTEYPELDVTRREVALLNKLYSLYRDVVGKMEEYSTILWSDVVANIHAMTEEMDSFYGRCKKMPKRLREWGAYRDLKAHIENFQTEVPLLQELSKASIRPRHWRALEEVLGCPGELPADTDPGFKLADLLRFPLVANKDEIEELCDSADKQLAIESKLAEISARWEVERFVFGEARTQAVPVLQSVPVLIEELEEAQLMVQTMLTMRHVTPFKKQASELLKTLSDTGDTLELWLKVQTLWGSLDVFNGGSDIARQLPAIAGRFAKTQKELIKIQNMAKSTEYVVLACENEVLRQSLPTIYETLERCQKALQGYLEQKRGEFARFYFVSDPVLLKMLAQGSSDPTSIQEFLEKIFAAISRVEFSRRDKNNITAFMSRSGTVEEKIDCLQPVVAKGNIEEWLTVLLKQMRVTMKDLADDCAHDVASLQNNLSGLRAFVDSQCGQYALLGLQLLWTADMEESLIAGVRGGAKALRAPSDRSLAILSELSSWCLTDLGSKMNRTKIETLVTVQVHQRDIAAELYATAKSAKSKADALTVDSFDWQKQARVYWRPDAADEVSPDGACHVAITDVTFDYQYEYLGCKERLVITPLTDRCYITLAQAHGMNLGGAPAGPAGTGKTETVKDLGSTLGLYVVVTNCSSEMRYTDCAKIFKGLCQSGAWGCFDEFNRIALPVLSVVAQMVLAITNAKRSTIREFTFPGDDGRVRLDPMCGYFITMNPGYAGRQELPENLKALFRGVSMMVPDREIIIKVKLVSAGYAGFSELAKKFFVCYRLAEEQLSNQKHYDFGLRNILSVLRTAGATKRANPDTAEDVLLFRTLRDMNLSKLVAQDVPLYLAMLQDVFPDVQPPAKAAYEDVETAVLNVVAKSGLVPHPQWLTKVTQLFETLEVRHGVMLVGPTGGGKTKILDVLSTALQSARGVQYRQVKIFPKALSETLLYGETDLNTGEWSNGIFSTLWARYNKRELSYHTFIVFDGPVDAMWIESMNTVLDDNKLLTLANGDRLPMTDNTKLLFETESLTNASPATVSRVGIVYVSATDLDWEPVMHAWVATQPVEMQPHLLRLFAKYVGSANPASLDAQVSKSLPAGVEQGDYGHAFEFLARRANPVMSFSRVGAVSSMFHLLEALLQNAPSIMAFRGNALGGAPTLAPGFVDALEHAFQYAATWGLAGLLDSDDRAAWHAFLEQEVGADIPSGASPSGEVDTVYEWFPALEEPGAPWRQWTAPEWQYPAGETLDFTNLLVPTMDSTRAVALVAALHNLAARPVLLVGGPGTAKTSTALMFSRTFSREERMFKRLNFSSATTAERFQETLEASLDKRGGKSFGPPGGKKMTVFIDDISMPEINEWGDQPTNEIVRQVMVQGGMYFRDKDKRGDFKVCEDLSWVGAMTHPGGGRNDVPDRLKRAFFVMNLVLPSFTSIDDVYGAMLRGRFRDAEFQSPAALSAIERLTGATIALWRTVKTKMLPTPAKFHYIFNMRDLSRVFQGILLTPKDTVRTGGVAMPNKDVRFNLLRLWHHEAARVFRDKLTSVDDKAWYDAAMMDVLAEHFGDDMAAAVTAGAAGARGDDAGEGEAAGSGGALFFNGLRDDVYDEDDILMEEAPLVYEDAGSLTLVRERVQRFMAQHNEAHPSTKLELVLFDDALRHLLRIVRIIAMPGGCALLVGVGGSGKQSLTRLAAFIERSQLFQITLTKSYNVNALLEDLRELYKMAGHERKSVTFLFTDSEIKDEAFLEYLNALLTSGEVGGLFSKDEMLAMCADLHTDFLAARPDEPDTPENLRGFFYEKARDNMHVVLCMSPVNPAFAARARKFPGLISGCTINWFLPWPEEALVAVSQGFLNTPELQAVDPAQLDSLQKHMGFVHRSVLALCDEYYASMRRHVYQTPKSYLAFLRDYRSLYAAKAAEIAEKEARVNLGVAKLLKAGEDVESLKLVLAEDQVRLERSSEEVSALLGTLETASLEVERESQVVAGIKSKCEAEATRIAGEKDACERDLAEARPFLEQAIEAVASIKPAHITEVKRLARPADIIRVVLDGVCIMLWAHMNPVQLEALKISKTKVEFVAPSFGSATSVMADPSFLTRLQTYDKDAITAEQVELLVPYLDFAYFQPEVARGASVAAEGLCIWVRALSLYYKASRIVQPKLEALAVAESKMRTALANLQEAEAREQATRDKMAALKAEFDAAVGRKTAMEERARALQRKMEQASALIRGLGDEKSRWMEDASSYSASKLRLLGDAALASAFISYAGPFNQSARDTLLDRLTRDLRARGMPVTTDLNVTEFLVDVGTIGDWSLQGLPSDPLSVQNGILVTRSSRYPLLVDPQGQALTWIKNRAKDNLPVHGVTTQAHPQFKDHLEYAMGEGKTLIVVGVEEELDPLLDPVLEHQVVTRGRRRYINVSDTMMELLDGFQLYFITRLPNPHFTPELQAKTTVVDFTVTRQGLEDQLLGLVIRAEKRELEEMLSKVLSEVHANRKALLELDAALLGRLTSNEGNLLDDEELIDVLANTKAKAREVKEKLDAADETKKSISEQRETYRPVATRGSVLYFSIVDMTAVNNMYQTSLAQFVSLFLRSIENAERAALAAKRVALISDTLTWTAYRYVARGLYEKDKLLFAALVAMKILVTAGSIDVNTLPIFMRAGATLDLGAGAGGRKPPAWLPAEIWRNLIALAESVPFFRSLLDNVVRNEAAWRVWYDSNEPEARDVPDYGSALGDSGEGEAWLRLLLVRCFRPDRAQLALRDFVRHTPEMGAQYVDPVTDTVEDIYADSSPGTPVIYLLSVGSDPTDAIESLAKRCKQTVEVISMGQGQEPVAWRALTRAVANGSWVLLGNAELGLELMDKLEDALADWRVHAHPDFRLFITALPHPKFPLGLLQVSTKVTNEPPAGLRAGLLRSYTTLIDQDRLERIDDWSWRRLVFVLAFMHSIAQERRKFGPLGWCVPYEFSTGDLAACLLFLERHMYSGAVSWPTLQYMVAEVNYGGRITDDLDRRLMATFTNAWLKPGALEPEFTFVDALDVPLAEQAARYPPADSPDVEVVRTAVAAFPDVENPAVFGLHANAELSFRMAEVTYLLDSMAETQPKAASGSADAGASSGSTAGAGASSLETAAEEKAAQLLARLPTDYDEDDVRLALRRQNGLGVPLNIFLFQECQRLQAVIAKVRGDLSALRAAIRGEVVMTAELQNLVTDLLDARVPKPWQFTPAGEEFSWLAPSLSAWFNVLVQRDEQSRRWLAEGRPPSFWLAGFFNPQGFLTGMKQEVARANRGNSWSLDDMVYVTQATGFERADQVSRGAAGEQGVLIHGLYVDGAGWDRVDGRLVEAPPKQLYIPMPVLHVSATTRTELPAMLNDLKRSHGEAPYEAPVYKYARRTDAHLIFTVPLPTKAKATHWVLRGVALLAAPY